ncbi:MAG: class I SAM-dependent methyltransferase, partial [Gallionellaceae bacterium]
LSKLPVGASVAAIDISWSRIKKGREFLESYFDERVRAGVVSFVGDMFHIPFADKSVDVVVTSHSLEPNGGMEEQILAELFRVARDKVIMIGPSFEHNLPEGRRRMDEHGYVKNLPEHIETLGGELEALFPPKNS